jgi:hypothetical protein
MAKSADLGLFTQKPPFLSQQVESRSLGVTSAACRVSPEVTAEDVRTASEALKTEALAQKRVAALAQERAAELALAREILKRGGA